MKVRHGRYQDRVFTIECLSSEIIDGVVVANHAEERYMHFACEDLELLLFPFPTIETAKP